MKVQAIVQSITSAAHGTYATLRVGLTLVDGVDGELDIYGKPTIRNGVSAIEVDGQIIAMGDMLTVTIGADNG